MATMKRMYMPSANERGAVLILALLVVMVLAVFSTVAVMSASQGLRISGKYKVQQQAVYVSDGAADFASGFIARAIGNRNLIATSDKTAPASTYVWINTVDTVGDGTSNLEKEIAGINGNSASAWTSLGGVVSNGLNPDTAKTTPNVTVTIMGDTANIDIDFMRSQLMPGSSTEFAARYEGIGSGTEGSVQLLYQVETYTQIGATEKTVRAIYKCVEGGGRCL